MVVRRRYHADLSVFLYVLVTMFLGVGAINSQNNLLFLVFGFAIAALTVSGLLSGAMMMGLRVAREAPAAGGVGQPLTLRYTLTNTRRFIPAFALTVEESDEATPGADAPTWRRLMPAPRAFVMHIGPRETLHFAASVTPSRRGEALFVGVRITSAFPFGLFRKSVIVEQRSSVPVLPRVHRLRRETARNLLTRGDAGVTTASLRGRGDEFYGLREYSPGDSPRLIAWKASARLDNVVVRENTAPTTGALWVVLNLNGRAADGPGPDKGADREAESAISLAASLVTTGLDAGMDVGLAAPDLDLLCTPAAAPRQRLWLLTTLARLDPFGPRSPDSGLSRRLVRLAQRAACVVVHAAAVDPTVGPPGARHLRAADLDQIAVQPQGPSRSAAPVAGAAARGGAR